MNTEEKYLQVVRELEMITALTDAERKSILRLMVGYAEHLKSTVQTKVDEKLVSDLKEEIKEWKYKYNCEVNSKQKDVFILNLIEKMIEDR